MSVMLAGLFHVWTNVWTAKPHLLKHPLNQILNGGRDRDRTCDPYHVKVVLSR
jgi:hypothetical protein